MLLLHCQYVNIWLVLQQRSTRFYNISPIMLLCFQFLHSILVHLGIMWSLNQLFSILYVPGINQALGTMKTTRFWPDFHWKYS